MLTLIDSSSGSWRFRPGSSESASCPVRVSEQWGVPFGTMARKWQDATRKMPECEKPATYLRHSPPLPARAHESGPPPEENAHTFLPTWTT